MEEPFTFKTKIFIEETVDMDAHDYGLLHFVQYVISTLLKNWVLI